MLVLIRSSGRAISGDWGRCQFQGNVFMQHATDFRPIVTKFQFSLQILINVASTKFNGNSSSGSRPLQFKYLGITLANQNSIREEIKRSLMLAIIRCRFFYLPVCCPKCKD